MPTTNSDVHEPVKCCEEFIQRIIKENLIIYLETVPYTNKPSDPSVSIISDSGHMRIAKINYCPFCGELITFKPRSENANDQKTDAAEEGQETGSKEV